MTVREAHVLWNESIFWVRERCREDMIWDVKKTKGNQWEIPDDAEKPPCTFAGMCKYLHLIKDVSSGVDVNLFPGKDLHKNEMIYRYLSDYGYITKLPAVIDEAALKKAKVASQGEVALKKYDDAKASTKTKEKEVRVGTENGSYSQKTTSTEM